MKTKTAVLIATLSVIFAGCKKGDVPVIETLDVEFYASTKATLGYKLLSDGDGTISSSGLIIGINQDLDASGTRFEMGVDTGKYFGQITGLTPNNKYFIKAFSVNETGEVFGETKSFITPDKVKDYDNNSYETVVIGTQIWTAENLKTTHYQNGELIGTTNPSSLDIGSEDAPKYEWVYNGDNTKLADYGRLYTWYAASDPRKVCPTGWHIPSDSEWTVLEEKLGGYTIAGSRLKEMNNDHWLAPYNIDASNLSCFSGLPGGFRESNGVSNQIQNGAYFWSSSQSETSRALDRELSVSSPAINRAGLLKNYGLSIRCIMD